MNYLLLLLLFPLFTMAQPADTLLEMEQVTFSASGGVISSICHIRDSSGRKQVTEFTNFHGTSVSVFDYDPSGRVLREKNYLADGSPNDSILYYYRTGRFVKQNTSRSTPISACGLPHMLQQPDCRY